MTLLELSWQFFCIGLFTIGGGQVAITLMYQPFVEGGLISAEDFYSMVAVSESTPGPIGINMATYIGCNLFGIPGGIITTLSTVLPSLIIIMLIAKFYQKYRSNKIVDDMFYAIRPVSAGLVAVAAWQVLRISVASAAVFSVSRLVFLVAAFTLLLKTKVSPILVIVLGAIFGLIFL